MNPSGFMFSLWRLTATDAQLSEAVVMVETRPVLELVQGGIAEQSLEFFEQAA